MNFLNGLSSLGLSVIFGSKKAEVKQNASKPNSSNDVKRSAPLKLSSHASSVRTSPRSPSEPRPSSSSPIQSPTWHTINYTGLKPPETLNEKKFESLKDSLKNAKDFKDFKRIYNEKENKLTLSQKKKLRDSLIEKLTSRNNRLKGHMLQLTGELKTLKQNMAKLGQSFTENSRVLTGYQNSLSKALTGNSDSKTRRNLTAGVKSYEQVDGTMSQVLADQREQLTSIQDKISSYNEKREDNKKIIAFLSSTGSPRILGG